MDLLDLSGDDSTGEEEDHNDLIARRTSEKDSEAPQRRGLRNITLLTEAEWNALSRSPEGVESAVPSAGRWATHCSCPVALRRSEQRQAWASIRATCDWIERRHPTYRGYCIPLFPMSLSHRKHSKRRKRADGSADFALSNPKVDSTLHISLTRPDISLHTNHVDSFAKLLTREIHTVVHVAPFSIQFQYTNILELFHNESRTKSYGIWRCFDSSSSASPLEQLTHACDAILEQYHQVPYRYADGSKDDAATLPPIFHVSLVRFEPAVFLPDSAVSSGNSPEPVCQPSPESEDEDAAACDSSSSEGSSDSDHVITRVICQFGCGAKIHSISLTAK
jgi:Uncharacterised conserved protein